MIFDDFFEVRTRGREGAGDDKGFSDERKAFGGGDGIGGVVVGSGVNAERGELAENGLAVIVISSEMPEVLGVSHRILTMSDGRMVGEFSGDEMTEKNLIEAVSHRPVENPISK